MKTIAALLVLLLAISSGMAAKKPHPKVSKAQATKTVMREFKGAKIEGSELEKEEGKLIWSFDLKAGGATKEVWVDANSGKVIKNEVESPQSEKAEQATDKAERAALKKIPGSVVKSTMKSKKGKEICSVEIMTKSGKTVEVDVDAKTNRVIQVETDDDTKHN